MKRLLFTFGIFLFGSIIGIGQDGATPCPVRLYACYETDGKQACRLAVFVKNTSDHNIKVLTTQPEWQNGAVCKVDVRNLKPVPLHIVLDASRSKRLSPELADSHLRPAAEQYGLVELRPGEYTSLWPSQRIVATNGDLDPAKLVIEYQVAKEWQDLYGTWTGTVSCRPSKVVTMDAVIRSED